MKNKLKSLLKHKKLLIAIVCVAVLLIVFSCSRGGDTTGEGAVKLYKSIITEYTDLLSAKQSGELPALTGEENDVTLALRQAVEAADPAVMGYATKDINGDGIDELVLLSGGCDLYALFTLVNKTPVLLLAMNGADAAIDENGIVYYTETVLDKSSFTVVKEIADGKLEGLEIGYTVEDGGKWVYYKETDGQREDSNNQEYLEMNNAFSGVFKRDTFITKTAGFRFVPAIAAEAEEEAAPALSLRTYDDVLAMYETIVAHCTDFSADAWVQGLYDAFYTFSDNESFAAFHAVLYACSADRPVSLDTAASSAPSLRPLAAFGYAYRDLDGDGTDELILMRMDYEILAIFTRDNGKIGLLAASTPLSRTVWIDEDGLIHISVCTGGVSAQDYAYYLCDISGRTLEAQVAIAVKKDPATMQSAAYYKLDGGKTAIEEAEWNELYARYDLFTEEAPDAKAYNKLCGGLTFTSLAD